MDSIGDMFMEEYQRTWDKMIDEIVEETGVPCVYLEWAEDAHEAWKIGVKWLKSRQAFGPEGAA